MIQRPMAFGAVALLLVFVAEGGHRNIAEILGATHMNPAYNFTTKPVLEEGSDVLRQMGSRAIKLWFAPSYANNYPQNHNWPTVSNCTELAQTSYFQAMFSDPNFLVYSLELSTFNARFGWQYPLGAPVFSASEYNAVFAEVYDLTAHLLSAYNHSGKTFILQNWEGDNALGQDASAQKVQSMIDWLNCWQDAINAARNDSTSSNVWVYGAAECNKVGDPNWSGARCYTDVFPHLQMDLYSYSSWWTLFNEERLLEDLNNIKRYAPDSAAFGHENVFLGEFGLRRNSQYGEEGNLEASRTVFEIGMDAGARFAFYWCVYDTEPTSHGLVLDQAAADLHGLPTDHSGRYYTMAQTYFKTNALTLDVFEDLADGFNECAGYGNMVVNTAVLDHFDNDPGRFRRGTTAAGELEYAFAADVRRLAIMGYEYGGDNAVTVRASKTGAAGSYANVPLRKIQNDADPATGWRRVLHKNQLELDPGYRYFTVQLDGTAHAWTPQIGSVRFYYERPPIVQTIQFGGLVENLSDTNHQAQVGADELVQWNGVDSWGGSFGLNGTLQNRAGGAFVSSPSTGLRLSTTLVSSAQPEGTNTYTSGGVLGIMGGDNAKFDAANEEQWAFEFNQDVVLKSLAFSALNDADETIKTTIAGVDVSFTRSHVNCSPAGWGSNRYIYTFAPPLQLAAGADVQIAATQGQWGLEGVVVSAGATASAYDLWAHTYGLAGTDRDWFADPDGNGSMNLSEYAFGGNPTNGAENGMAPTYALQELGGGTNVLEYVYRRRRDALARGLDYRVVWSENLVSNTWIQSGVSEINSAVLDESFEAVTNRISVDSPQKFIQLEIEWSE